MSEYLTEAESVQGLQTGLVRLPTFLLMIQQELGCFKIALLTTVQLLFRRMSEEGLEEPS